MENDKEGKKVPSSFAVGVVALVFLAVGYQTAIFIHRAATVRIAADRDTPDTVFVYEQLPESPPSDKGSSLHGNVAAKSRRYVNKAGHHTDVAVSVRKNTARRSYECFEFDPNTATAEDFVRMGFSLRQAESICNYRLKGGRFWRKEDFAKSFVVADSVYRRLEPFIRIPKLDINRADSASFDALPGIGPWFAAKMVSYRNELKGYSYVEQLMDIYRFDEARFNAVKDFITISLPREYPLWTLPEDSLRLHPYIRSSAHGIVLFRENNPHSDYTLSALANAGVLNPEMAEKLSRCRIASGAGDDVQ